MATNAQVPNEEDTAAAQRIRDAERILKVDSNPDFDGDRARAEPDYVPEWNKKESIFKSKVFDLEENALQDDWNERFQLLGSLLHKTQCTTLDAKSQEEIAKAYEKLLKAADGKVSDDYIKKLEAWDGAANFENEDEHNDIGSDSDEGGPPPEDTIDPPPDKVMVTLLQATQYMQRLFEDPDWDEAEAALEAVNRQIQTEKGDEDRNMTDNGIPARDDWYLKYSYWHGAYEELRRCRDPSKFGIEPEAAVERGKDQRRLIRRYVKSRQLPSGWAKFPPMMTNEKPKQSTKKPNQSTEKPPESTKPPSGELVYPWKTQKFEYGTALGFVRCGFGYRVCVEIKENGKIIRSLMAGVDTGIDLKECEHKKSLYKISEKQSEWTYLDRRDFKEILWVTKAQGKRKHMTGRQPDPAAYCCVRFESEKTFEDGKTKSGLQLLTMTSLKKVKGKNIAEGLVEKVCARDGIVPPWKAGYKEEIHDSEVLKEENRQKRAAERAAEAEGSSSATSSASNGGRDSNASGHLEEPKSNLDSILKEMRDFMAEARKDREVMQDMMKTFMAFVEANTPKTASASS
ncbi:hypothetical protein BBO_09573 [Beauveria brongniartii RCEF 3172]|uniref:Uncharacterized protein n=1 Tax=Beauveria brongniartii RCEF 3172 TaxID=1081107 RepID=A0A167WB39_9HYPO|nr:hypothetical protein BBO_09573 [Beauveria brongniartii RCEF 3172]